MFIQGHTALCASFWHVKKTRPITLKEQLEKNTAAFREEKFRLDPKHYTELLDTRIQISPNLRDTLIEQLKGAFGKYYDYCRRDISANEVNYLNMKIPAALSRHA
ncbi:plasmid mobilization system relaxase [Ligilactobacillus ruminis CAG:367]|nr:plasmid mobilization system relaxase [Ligilactobacillus ruminis CAG:367]